MIKPIRQEVTTSIEYLPEAFSIETKKLPMVIHSTCPICGFSLQRDLTQDPLHCKVSLNQNFEIELFHYTEKQELHVWSLEAVLKVGLFQVPPAYYLGWGPYENKIKIVKAIRSYYAGYSLKDAKAWSEKARQPISLELADILEKEGAIIERRK